MGERDADLDAIERALGSLLRLSASRRVFADRAAAAGVVVSQPGSDLLSRLGDGVAMSLGDLGRTTHMDPSAVGRQVRQLEAQGLLVREPDPDDGRVTRVRATRRGDDVRRRLGEAGRRHVADALSAWSPADRAGLALLLPQLVADMRAHRYPSWTEETA